MTEYVTLAEMQQAIKGEDAELRGDWRDLEQLAEQQELAAKVRKLMKTL